jgi:hypothetical protein
MYDSKLDYFITSFEMTLRAKIIPVDLWSTMCTFDVLPFPSYFIIKKSENAIFDSDVALSSLLGLRVRSQEG